MHINFLSPLRDQPRRTRLLHFEAETQGSLDVFSARRPLGRFGSFSVVARIRRSLRAAIAIILQGNDGGGVAIARGELSVFSGTENSSGSRPRTEPAQAVWGIIHLSRESLMSRFHRLRIARALDNPEPEGPGCPTRPAVQFCDAAGVPPLASAVATAGTSRGARPPYSSRDFAVSDPARSKPDFSATIRLRRRPNNP